MSEIIGYNEIYKNKRTMKVHLAIDSKQRNKDIFSKNKNYSDPNDYQIVVNKYKKLKNVISARIIEAMIPNSEYIINNNNKFIDILFNSTIYNVELTIGNYTFSSLSAEINNKIASFTSTNIADWTIILNNTDTFTTSIENNNSNDFTLLFETGPNNDCSTANILGFKKKDVESSNFKVISDFSYHLNSTKYVDIKIDEIPDIGTTLDIREDLQTHILKRIPIDVEFGKEAFYQSGNGDNNYNYFSPIELSKLNIKIFNDNGKIYDSNRIDNYFLLELIILSDDAPDNSELLPIQTNLNENFENEKKNIIKQNLANDNLLETKINDLTDEKYNIEKTNASSNNNLETKIQDLNIDNEEKNKLELNKITDDNIGINKNKNKLLLTIGENNYDLNELYNENKSIIILLLLVLIIFMFLRMFKS